MQNFMFLIIGSVITFFGALIPFVEKRKQNKSEKKLTIYTNGAFATLTIGIICSFYSGCNAILEKQKSDEIRVIKDSLLLNAQVKLQEKTDYIVKLQQQNKIELITLNDSLDKAKGLIIRTQTQTINQITGGNSFPYARITGGTDFQLFFAIDNIGIFPLYDLVVSIRDEELDNSRKLGLTYLAETFEEPKNIGNLAANSTFQSILIDTKDDFIEKNLEISFDTRNTKFIQLMKIRKGSLTPFTASRVLKQEGKKFVTLYEHIDPNFLRQNEKAVSWKKLTSKNSKGLPYIKISAENK